MNEFELIDRHFRREPRNADVRIGIGDDGAVFAPSPGMEYVVTVDMLVENRHFSAGGDPRALGHKALAVNLSDLAAMGALPRFALLAGALPDADAAWVAEFMRGFDALAPIERAVLAIGAWELAHRLEIPYRVVINEAVELAKRYGGTDGYKFVNGVLDKFAARARADEMNAAGRR
jgi:hypothetical protein